MTEDDGFEPFGHARRNGEVIDAKRLRKVCPQLHAWLGELLGSGYEIDRYVTIRDHGERLASAGIDFNVSISLYSSEYEFVVSASGPGTGKPIADRSHRGIRRGKRYRYKKRVDNGYLGAGLVSRAPLPGEHHIRGNDLTDGSFSEKTWKSVVADIVRNSLVELPPIRVFGPHPNSPSKRKKRRTTTRLRRKKVAK